MDENLRSMYMGVFLDELDEQLQILDHSILELEQDGNNSSIIQTVFRAAHTLKGSSAAMGFEQIKELMHRVESVFDLLRTNKLELGVEMVNVLFLCVDYLKKQRESFMQGHLAEDSIQHLIIDLEKNLLESGVQAFPTEVSALQGNLNPLKLLNVAERKVISQRLQQGDSLYISLVSMQADVEMPMVRAMLVLQNLSELGEVLATLPNDLDQDQPSLFQNKYWVYVISTNESMEKIENQLKRVSLLEEIQVLPVTDDQLFYNDDPLRNEAAAEGTEALEPKSAVEVKQLVNQTVRVDVNRLEHLLNLVGELIIDNTRLQEVKNRMSIEHKADANFMDLNDISSHLSVIISELQDGMMKTRMLPIEQLFNRFPRLVRDLAQKAGKEISFIMEGKETELDRTLIEEISDPLIHILRNAADHGIESPEEREKLGKPRQGQLALKASHHENAIVIKIKDDGKGIDPQKIKQKALQLGFVTDEEISRMTDKEIIALIFHSGMSTAEKVTELSGRGVGMDIVRSHIEKLNGIVEIETELGKGTIFTLKLPLTLAIIRSLLVEIGSRTFAIPLVNVLEIFRLQNQDIKSVHGQEVCKVRGDILPIIRLHDKLHANKAKDSSEDKNNGLSRWFAVVIGVAEKRVCLLVDRPLANQEIVMKSLGEFVGQIPFVTGSTILGNGSIALILDVNAIVREAGSELASARNERDEQSTLRASETKLVTLRMETEKYALDIGLVKEIVPVPVIAKILTTSPFVLGLINLRGVSLPVYDLHAYLNLPTRLPGKNSKIIIIHHDQLDVGILVDQVEEVQTVKTETIEAKPRGITQNENDIISGICKINESFTFILQLEAIFKQKMMGLAN